MSEKVGIRLKVIRGEKISEKCIKAVKLEKIKFLKRRKQIEDLLEQQNVQFFTLKYSNFGLKSRSIFFYIFILK